MKTLVLLVAAIILSITLIPAPASAQNALPMVNTPSWLVGELTGEQRVIDRPTWRPAGLEANLTSAGTWEINLQTPSGQQTIQGSVTAVTTDTATATLKGKYTMGRNYGK